MSKFLLSVIFFLFVFNFYSQNTDKNIRGFKNGQTTHQNYDEIAPKKTSDAFVKPKFVARNDQKIASVTANRFTGSTNAYGVLISESKPLQFVTGINAISFIHRKSSTYIPSSNGNSSSIVGMYSTNTGTTWDSTCVWANATNFANNPQGAIYNPFGNTNINNAYMVGCGPLNNGAGWIGNWYASKKITTPGNTTPGTDQQALSNLSLPNWMKHHFSQYSFTAIEGLQVRSIGNIMSDPNGISNVTRGLRGAAMVKGQFNAGAFVWSIDSFIPCIMSRADGSKYLNEKMIQAWSESGTVGYVVMLGVRCGSGPCSKSYQPIVYKTTNSGSSWTLLPSQDFTGFKILTDRLYPINTNSTAIVPYFSSNEGIDATVDINSNLHIACTVVGAYSSHNDSLDYTYSYGSEQYNYSYSINGFGYPTVYDFYTTSSGGWNCHIVDSIGTEAPVGPFGSLYNMWNNGSIGKIDYNARLQMSRTKDGKKIFYSWTESDSMVVGVKWNIYPDIKIRGYDVTINKFTPRVNITQAITTPYNADQEAFFHYMSPQAISTGTTSFEVPITISHNPLTDVSLPVDHIYLKGVTMAATSFSLFPWLAFGSGFSTCSTLDTPEEKQHTNSFEIIPNPTSSIASISLFSDKIQFAEISIYDHLGRFIENKEVKCGSGLNSIPIDLSAYASGLYLIRVSTASFTETNKIVKE